MRVTRYDVLMVRIELGPNELTDGLPPEEFERILEGLSSPDAETFAASLSLETLIRFFDTPLTNMSDVKTVLSLMCDLEVWEVDDRWGTVEKVTIIKR